MKFPIDEVNTRKCRTGSRITDYMPIKSASKRGKLFIFETIFGKVIAAQVVDEACAPVDHLPSYIETAYEVRLALRRDGVPPNAQIRKVI